VPSGVTTRAAHGKTNTDTNLSHVTWDNERRTEMTEEERFAIYEPAAPTDPKRFYVSMTWDNWPEGGSYGTVVLADDETSAEYAARWEMAQTRDEFDHPGDAFDALQSEWHVVDCFKIEDAMAHWATLPSARCAG
jgi:hypothetical protein